MCIYILHSVNEKSIQFEANLFILVNFINQTTLFFTQLIIGQEKVIEDKMNNSNMVVDCYYEYCKNQPITHLNIIYI